MEIEKIALKIAERHYSSKPIAEMVGKTYQLKIETLKVQIIEEFKEAQALQLLENTVSSSSYSSDLCLKNVEQMLIDNISDFLDSEDIIIQESIAELKDPIPREKTELHIRMAKSAMKEYKSTMVGL